jgi:hypothetical protein
VNPALSVTADVIDTSDKVIDLGSDVSREVAAFFSYFFQRQE